MGHLSRLAAKLLGGPTAPHEPRPILFISHDALRTGAPVVLLHLVRWVKERSKVPFQILLRSGGELARDFEALGPTIVFDEHGKYAPDAALAAFLKPDFQLIYSNTSVNGDVLETLAHRGIPVVSHIHELEKMIRYHVGYDLFDRVKARTSFYIAASEAVRDNLVEQHGIEPDRIEVIHEFIEIPALTEDSRLASRREVREALGLPKEAFVVGASGTTDWRKGPDLFIQLARVALKQRPGTPLHFLWIGGGGPEATFYERKHHEYAHLQHDVAHAGLAGRVHFIGSVDRPIDHFCAMDAFVSTSREDPFPVVCLEAGALGIPLLCFRGAGGIQELVRGGCGYVVDYLDVEEMAARILGLQADPDLRGRLGQRAAEAISRGHSVEVGATRVCDTIRRVFGTDIT